jgi:hypothetical protein
MIIHSHTLLNNLAHGPMNAHTTLPVVCSMRSLSMHTQCAASTNSTVHTLSAASAHIWNRVDVIDDNSTHQKHGRSYLAILLSDESRNTTGYPTGSADKHPQAVALDTSAG